MAKVKTKIWWRDFVHTPAFQRMQRSLAEDGHHLKVIWEENSDQKIAKDVHIYRVDTVAAGVSPAPVEAAVSAAIP